MLPAGAVRAEPQTKTCNRDSSRSRGTCKWRHQHQGVGAGQVQGRHGKAPWGMPLTLPAQHAATQVSNCTICAQQHADAHTASSQGGFVIPSHLQRSVGSPECLRHSLFGHTSSRSMHLFGAEDSHAALWMQEADLDAYEAMPIASFGEAMLRGMGWREGMSVGRNVPKEVRRLKPKAIVHNRRGVGIGVGIPSLVEGYLDPSNEAAC